MSAEAKDFVHVVEPYEDAEQQLSANRMGMWIFLTSELMLFGGIFLGILVMRVMHPDAYAEASGHTDLMLGSLNTAVLLTSSLTMAIAVIAGHHRRRGLAMAALGATAVLGLGFLGIKGYEYWKEYTEGLMPGIGPAFPLKEEGTMLFFNLYFAATGLHAAHLTLAILSVAAMIVAWARRAPRLPEATEGVGLYWHLVDVIWVWLYPMLYLVGR